MKRVVNFLLVSALLVLTVCPVALVAADDSFVDLQFTDKQARQIGSLIDEFMVKESIVENRIDTIENQIVENALKADRFSSETLNRIRSNRFNMLLANLGETHCELLRHRLSFLVSIRNILTIEQLDKMVDDILDATDTFFDFEEDTLLGMDLTDPRWGVDLSIEQEREILDDYARRDIRNIRLVLALDHQLLDMVELIKTGKRISKEADLKINEIGEVATRIIENEILSFVVTKDILTVEQKRAIVNVLLAD